jgi:hypothetical protein
LVARSEEADVVQGVEDLGLEVKGVRSGLIYIPVCRSFADEVQTPGERRFLLATGADVTDCDVVTQPLLSAADFEKRLSPWLKEVDEHEGGREKAIVAFFGTVKKNISESGKDFTTCVEAPCHRYVRQDGTELTSFQIRSGCRAWKYHLACCQSRWSTEISRGSGIECPKG